MKRTRAELHEAFVNWVETSTGDRTLEYEEIRGYHLEQAYSIRTERGIPDESIEIVGRRAAAYLGSAGRRALARVTFQPRRACSGGRPPPSPTGIRRRSS